MKTNFPTLIKSMRLTFKPDFKSLETLEDEAHSNLLDMIERKSLQMIIDNGYTEEEFYKEYQEYSMDFSSDNPDEWIIKHEPVNSKD